MYAARCCAPKSLAPIPPQLVHARCPGPRTSAPYSTCYRLLTHTERLLFNTHWPLQTTPQTQCQKGPIWPLVAQSDPGPIVRGNTRGAPFTSAQRSRILTYLLYFDTIRPGGPTRTSADASHGAPARRVFADHLRITYFIYALVFGELLFAPHPPRYVCSLLLPCLAFCPTSALLVPLEPVVLGHKYRPC